MNILLNDKRETIEHNFRILENRYSEIHAYCTVEYDMNKHFQLNRMKVESQMNQTSREAMLMILEKNASQ